MDKTNKLQLRAQILKNLEEIKKKIDKKSLDFDKEIKSFEKTDDKKTLFKTVIKEFQGNSSAYDYFLSQILTRISSQDAETCIFEAIMSDNTSDVKKIYLINILKEINKDANYDALTLSVQDAFDKNKEEINHEFVFSVNHQIDFLDFYFASDREDKIELLNNLFDTSDGDETAHMLSLILYSGDTESTKYVIEKLGQTRSYLSFPPLRRIINNSDNKEYVSLSKKAINELKISGLRKEIGEYDLYKTILSESRPLSAWVTDIDGASNYVLMIARERQNACITFFSVIINLKYGIIDCFGFEDLERSEFRDIATKIFNEDKVFQIPIKNALALLKEAEKDSDNSKNIIPYEYFAWRALTYDMENGESINSYIKENIKKIDLDKSLLLKIKNAQFFKNWFLKIADSQEFEKLVKKINSSNSMEDIEELISANHKKVFKKIYEKQLLYQSYISHLAGQKELSSILYSLIDNKELKSEFQKYILKKSIFIYYKEQKENAFAKNVNTKISKEIEEQWEKEF